MQVKNSYIFLPNPYKKEPERKEGHNDNVIFIDLGHNVYSFIRNIFPVVKSGSMFDNPFQTTCTTTVKLDNFECLVTFVINEVQKNTFLDVIVTGKSKLHIIKSLEYVHTQLDNSDISKYYIRITSYDFISEYYCNKLYPKLNTLERNLRKLLFNIYIVNFGSQYYQATFGKDLQAQVKKIIHPSGGEEKRETAYLQEFFYSLDFGNIQRILFTSSWTDIDQNEKDNFLSAHNDLSKLSDDELRAKFVSFSPKSDWERFFSKKIKIDDIEQLLNSIRQYRNKVAHCKFLNAKDYNQCTQDIRRFNRAIVKAIKITESKDFMEKNTIYLKSALEDFAKNMERFRQTIACSLELSFRSISETLAPAVDTIQNKLNLNSKTNILKSDFQSLLFPDGIENRSKDTLDDTDTTDDSEDTPKS